MTAAQALEARRVYLDPRYMAGFDDDCDEGVYGWLHRLGDDRVLLLWDGIQDGGHELLVTDPLIDELECID